VVLIGGSVGVLLLRQFIYERLSPMVSQSLTNLVNRPVEVGEVESFWLDRIRLGESTVPPTATDRDRVDIEAVDVRFNLWEVVTQRRLTLNVTLVEPSVYLDQTADGAWLQTEFSSGGEPGPIKINLDRLNVDDATVTLQPFDWDQLEAIDTTAPEFNGALLAPDADGAIAPLVLQQVNGGATFRNDNTLIGFEADGTPDSGGRFGLQGEADLQNQRLNLSVQGNQLAIPAVGTLVRSPLTFQDGTANANLDVALNLQELMDFDLQGSLRFQDLAATIDNVPNDVNSADGVLRFQGQTITVEDTTARYGEIEAIARGTVDLTEGFDLAIELPSLSIDNVLTTFEVPPPELTLAGLFQVNATITGALDDPQINGTLTNRQTVQIDRVGLDVVNLAFAVTPEQVTVSSLNILPEVGGQITGNGRIQLGQRTGLVFNAAVENVSADALAILYGANLPENLSIGTVNATLQAFGPLTDTSQLRAIAAWQTNGTYPAQGEIAYTNNTVQVQNTVVQALGGTLTAAGQASLTSRQWNAAIAADQIAAGQFSPQLRGVLTADVDVSGTLDQLSPAGITADGTASLSDGVSVLQGPLNAQFNWRGDRLTLERAEAPNFYADGTIDTDLSQSGARAIAALNLNVQIEQFDLATVPDAIGGLPDPVMVGGLVSFDGQVTGDGANPVVFGQTRLDNLAVNQIPFDPTLAGTVQVDLAQGVALDVSGQNDRIAVALDNTFLPTAVLVEITDGETMAAVRALDEGDRTLIGEIEQFPLAWLEVAPAAEQGLGIVRGQLTSTLQANIADLSNPIVTANVRVTNPAIGYIDAQRFEGQLFYGNGQASLTSGELAFPNSLYRIAANYNPARSTYFQSQIIAEPGEVSDLLFALKILDLNDFARGLTPPTYAEPRAIAPVPIDVRELSILNRLRRLAEITILQDRQTETEQETRFSLPSPSDASGQFTGEITLAAAQDTGVSADFDLRGEDWLWGPYGIDRVVAIGELRNSTLTLLPVRAESGDAIVNLSGRIGGSDQSAQLTVENVPVAPIRDLAKLPLAIDGTITANALLTGSITAPSVTGALNLVNGTLNATPLESAGVRLSYNNARLNFVSEIVVGEIKGALNTIEDPNPLSASGSIPYALPFMTIAPDSEDIQLSIAVDDDGLALMNLFTDQVAWLDGGGSVQLEVDGTLSNPIVVGTATVQDATFSAQALPEPITDVSGQVNFNRDRILVEGIEGQFSQGIIQAQGSLPIIIPVFGTATDETTPLTVALRDIDMNFRGLYSGGVAGNILITGTALAPLLSGDVVLSDGTVFLPSGESPPPAEALPPQEEDAEPGLTRPPELNDLVVTLGRDIRISSEPLINFIATGDLVVNGGFNDLRPQGTIQLERGFVNLFTTRFNLTNPTDQYSQTAIFSPTQGLIPSLQVRLLAVVPDVTNPPVFSTTTGFASSEVADSVISASDFGTVESVRIVATVDGPADRVFENLSLTSDPSRSESEIVALLGGGALSALEAGDETLVVANLAGSALLNSLQSVVRRALGLSDFRLFPTSTTSEESGASTLGLAAEVGLNVTDDLSVSILQVLTAAEAPQLGLRYRLNDEFRVRGTISSDGNPSAVLEYQIQF
jgi:translocation and assembly module TamB